MKKSLHYIFFKWGSPVLFTALLRYNLHMMKYTPFRYTINKISFNKLVELCYHYKNLVLEHFLHSKILFILYHNQSALHPAPGSHLSAFCLYRFAYSEISHKWIYTITWFGFCVWLFLKFRILFLRFTHLMACYFTRLFLFIVDQLLDICIVSKWSYYN